MVGMVWEWDWRQEWFGNETGGRNDEANLYRSRKSCNVMIVLDTWMAMHNCTDVSSNSQKVTEAHTLWTCQIELPRKESVLQTLSYCTPSLPHTLSRLGHSVIFKVFQTTALRASTEIMHKLLECLVFATPALPQAVLEQSVLTFFFCFIPTLFLFLLAVCCQPVLPRLLRFKQPGLMVNRTLHLQWM